MIETWECCDRDSTVLIPKKYKHIWNKTRPNQTTNISFKAKAICL